MKIEDQLSFIRQQEAKFGYGLFSISLLISSLSLQFSPHFGQDYGTLLLFCWIFYLISIFLSGYRIIEIMGMWKINFEACRLQNLASKNEEVLHNQKKLRDGFRRKNKFTNVAFMGAVFTNVAFMGAVFMLYAGLILNAFFAILNIEATKKPLFYITKLFWGIFQ